MEPFPLQRTISQSISSQKNEGTCFAHTATFILFHNVYHLDLLPEDIELYESNHCNRYLNTTVFPLELDVLKEQCGNSGASRILLFLYIYEIIVNKFGTDGGDVSISMRYYLNGEYLPPFHSEEYNDMAESLTYSIDLEQFTSSTIPVEQINLKYLHELFDDNLYIGLNFNKPEHSITLVGIEDTYIIAKDSNTSTIFNFPIKQLNRKGTIQVNDVFFKNCDNLNVLYKKDDIDKYPHFKRLLKGYNDDKLFYLYEIDGDAPELRDRSHHTDILPTMNINLVEILFKLRVLIPSFVVEQNTVDEYIDEIMNMDSFEPVVLTEETIEKCKQKMKLLDLKAIEKSIARRIRLEYPEIYDIADLIMMTKAIKSNESSENENKLFFLEDPNAVIINDSDYLNVEDRVLFKLFQYDLLENKLFMEWIDNYWR
jgi:hypothetical protein